MHVEVVSFLDLLSIVANLYELHAACYPSVLVFLKLVHSNREVTAPLSACALLPYIRGAQRNSHFLDGAKLCCTLVLAMPAVGVTMCYVRSISYNKQILCKASKKRAETSKLKIL